jgi:phosphoribosylanthranilate isomerase
MRDADNIRAVSSLCIDMMGFIFYQKSPRFVAQISSNAGVIPDFTVSSLIKDKGQSPEGYDPKNIKRVGVFVDEMPQSIITRVYNFDLDYVQLHGNETPILIDNLRATIDPDIRKGVKFIKTISISSADDIKKCEEYEGHADMFLFDTKCDTKGGSGEKFDWSILQAYKGNTPFILSGGIAPNDVERIKNFSHPQFVGIDLNSNFEIEPAVKDVEKLKDFITKIR